MPDDHRYTIRVEPKGLVSKKGQLFLTPSSDPIECLVVDLSAGGACLEMSTQLELPGRFEFRHGGLRRYCRLTWRRGFRFGIKFDGSRHMSTGPLSRPSAFRPSRFR